MEALKTAAEATGMGLPDMLVLFAGVVMVAAATRLLRPPSRCGNWRMRQQAKRRQAALRQAERREREQRRRLAGSRS